MIEDSAKEAAAARENLQQKLLQCAEVLTQVATAMVASAVELAEAAEIEQQATARYVAELERQLHQQALN